MKNILKILRMKFFCKSYRRYAKSTLEALASGNNSNFDAIGCENSVIPNKTGLICKKGSYKSQLLK